jgi:hypothetical protein
MAYGRMVTVVQPRTGTKFTQLLTFKEAVDSFGPTNTKVVKDHALRFESAWCNSRSDGDLPARYHFEHYKGIHDPYRLCHVRVGPNNNYRAVVLFPDGSLEAYWVYAYKKEGRREPQEMKRARDLASRYWETRKGK